jgi:hypothetical protein
MNQILVFQKIIEQESKTSTYKFALLRAVIDIITAQSPHIEVRTNQVAIPILLISDKWIFYYWDLIGMDYPQINGDRKLVFNEKLQDLKNKFINYWTFHKEFHKQLYRPKDKKDFIGLAKKLNDTIKNQPMKYIGSSIGDGEYSLFQFEKGKMLRTSSTNGFLDLLNNSPKLIMKKTHYKTLKQFGGLFSGTNSIIINWVDFIEKQKKHPNQKKSNRLGEKEAVYKNLKHNLTSLTPLQILLQTENVERDTKEIRNFWEKRINAGEPIYCTWSGKLIKDSEDLAIDHAIPFSVLFNNDYWNLFPTKIAVNGKKTDLILSKKQIQDSMMQILETWEAYGNEKKLSNIFNAQCQISLIKSLEFTHEQLLEKFLEINQNFINLRGMKSWEWTTDSSSTIPE